MLDYLFYEDALHVLVVGSGHDHPGGKNRQKVLKNHCQVGMKAALQREPDLPGTKPAGDPRPVAVMLLLPVRKKIEPTHIGDLPKEAARLIGPLLALGEPLEGEVAAIFGGGADNPDYWVYLNVRCPQKPWLLQNALFGKKKAAVTVNTDTWVSGVEGKPELTPGMAVQLVREPKNTPDPNAVAVMVESSGQVLLWKRTVQRRLGYLSRELAWLVAPFMDCGGQVRATVKKIEPAGGADKTILLSLHAEMKRADAK